MIRRYIWQVTYDGLPGAGLSVPVVDTQDVAGLVDGAYELWWVHLNPVILFHTRVARSSGRGCLLGEICLVQISFEDDQVVLMILGLKMDEEEIKTGKEWHRFIVVR